MQIFKIITFTTCSGVIGLFFMALGLGKVTNIDEDEMTKTFKK